MENENAIIERTPGMDLMVLINHLAKSSILDPERVQAIRLNALDLVEKIESKASHRADQGR